jgi:carboxyl-terminal processing protease
MVRRKINVESVSYELLESSMGYIRIAQFTDNTANQFNVALSNLTREGARGLIIDLRQCPGGTVNSAIDMSGAFLGTGPAIFVESGGDMRFAYSDGWAEISLPIAVLVNENTASAAELLAANIQDASRAAIIGTQTFGKGVMQTVFSLPSGAGIVFTTDKFFSVDFWSVEDNKGVTPDIYVADPTAQLQKAEEWLKTQKGRGTKLSFTAGALRGFLFAVIIFPGVFQEGRVKRRIWVFLSHSRTAPNASRKNEAGKYKTPPLYSA